MKATELLRFQLEMSKNLTAGLLADMVDAPLIQPTSAGGNHPTWIAGHLAYSEARLTSEVMFGKPNPLVDWKERFKGGSQPTTEASDYPPLSDLLAEWDKVRENTLAVVDSLSDEDLDKPCANPPEGREEFFGTFGKVLSIVSSHALMHRGQVADARRAAGREILMA